MDRGYIPLYFFSDLHFPFFRLLYCSIKSTKIYKNEKCSIFHIFAFFCFFFYWTTISPTFCFHRRPLRQIIFCLANPPSPQLSVVQMSTMPFYHIAAGIWSTGGGCTFLQFCHKIVIRSIFVQ